MFVFGQRYAIALEKWLENVDQQVPVRTQVAVLPDQLRRNVSLTVHVELSRKQAA